MLVPVTSNMGKLMAAEVKDTTNKQIQEQTLSIGTISRHNELA